MAEGELEPPVDFARAQTLVRSVIDAVGHRDLDSDRPMMALHDMMHNLAMAQGMLLAAHSGLKTPGDLRDAAQFRAAFSRRFAVRLRSGGEEFIEDVEAHLR